LVIRGENAKKPKSAKQITANYQNNGISKKQILYKIGKEAMV